MKRELINSLLEDIKKEYKEPNNDTNCEVCIKMIDYMAF
ncbi:hypothetical protein SAMN05444401_1310 [Clostridium amylolyticum]|uniref:Uncharacterized protein n=1 Tax=Clostridium amylolyticum TaxID=1121298 RepID=A0A1M6D1M1_9CLOT|nr:hypothetical protein SAMN05444401_1310 [Clostridium amylolyticum]